MVRRSFSRADQNNKRAESESDDNLDNPQKELLFLMNN
jgi:hypothetical protein